MNVHYVYDIILPNSGGIVKCYLSGRGRSPYAGFPTLLCTHAGMVQTSGDGVSWESLVRSAASSIPLRSMPDKAGHAVSLAGVRPMQPNRHSPAFMQA